MQQTHINIHIDILTTSNKFDGNSNILGSVLSTE